MMLKQSNSALPRWHAVLCLALLLVSGSHALPQKRLGPFIKHYEPVNYDRSYIHSLHTDFSKRFHKGQTIHFEFNFTIEAHGKVFHLEMHPDEKVFAPNAQFLDGSGNPIDFERTTMLEGRVAGDPSSSVHGSINHGRFRGLIDAFGEKYTIEPARVHFDEDQVFHSVIYKDSDTDHAKALGNNSCGGDHSVLDDSTPALASHKLYRNLHKQLDDQVKSRQRRALDLSFTECRINIGADHIYAKEIARIENLQTADPRVAAAVFQTLGTFVREVNKIYSTTKFLPAIQGGPEGVSMVILAARIFLTAAEMKQFGGGNSPLAGDFLDSKKVLDSWGEMNWDEYCLSYLFTHRDLEESVLGLAYVGTFCEKFRGSSAKNTGIVTTRSAGQRLTQRSANLVFAHEIGHNFGSRHDEGATCDPTGGGGKFIMHKYSNDGSQPNHFKFSPCSIQQMGSRLQVKAFDDTKNCFHKDSMGRICGNSIKEDGEECDCGAHDVCTAAAQPQCCQVKARSGTSSTNDCKYATGSVCTFQDGPCCDSCAFVTADQNRSCSQVEECRIGQSQCNGMQASCPLAPPKADKTLCNKGRATCLGGECNTSLCALGNLNSCFCGAPDECAVCCMVGETCTPMRDINTITKTGLKLNLVPGAPCDNYQGTCNFLNFCRKLSDTGLLFQITNTLLNLNTFSSAWDWAKTNWYYVLLGFAGVIAMFALIIHFFSKKTPRTVRVTAKNRAHRNGGSHELQSKERS